MNINVNALRNIIAFCFLFFTAQTQADVVGLHAGAGVWKPDIDGNFGLTDTITTSELGVKADDANYFYIALEHPVPVLPNIRITHTTLEAGGESTLTSDFTFDEVTFPAGTDTISYLDATHTDYTAYYEVLDNVASADIGLTFRSFDGNASVEGTYGSENYSEAEEFSVVAPMLYGRVQVDLPLTGFYLGGTVNYIGMDGDKLQDLEARVGYMMSIVAASLGVELGYRKTSMQYADDDDLNVDLNFDGSYAAVVFHF